MSAGRSCFSEWRAALFRGVLDGGDGFVAQRVSAMSGLVERLHSQPAVSYLPVRELDVEQGYAAWASTYDTMSNALIRVEEPLVTEVLADLEPGRALDAACGTGRHCANLAARGHRVVGVDRSEAMLEVARRKLPTVDFRVGDLQQLPMDDGSVDLAVCALALTHEVHLRPAVAELGRVVRPGGTVVITDAHPAYVLIQGQALFPYDDGFAFVRNHAHLHSSYLGAFAAASLKVHGCREAAMDADFTEGPFAGASDAATMFWAGIPVVLVWTLRR